METHHIETILLALPEDAYPLLLIGRRITREREATVLYRATDKRRTAVDQQLAPFNLDVAHAKDRLVDIIAGIDRQLI